MYNEFNPNDFPKIYSRESGKICTGADEILYGLWNSSRTVIFGINNWKRRL